MKHSEKVMPAEAGIQSWTPAFAGVTAFLLFFLSLPTHASEAQLKAGNRLFGKGHYEEALKQYNDALIDAPNSSVLRFNTGDAAYQMGDFPAAEKQFIDTAAQTADPRLRAAAHYNRGNALFRQNKWKEAIDAYKDSLRINPNDEDAKYNLGLALEVQKNPSQASAQPKPDKGKNKDQKGSPKKTAAQPKPGDMSKDDAERLLSAAGSGEPKKPNTKTPSGAAHPDEDW